MPTIDGELDGKLRNVRKLFVLRMREGMRASRGAVQKSSVVPLTSAFKQFLLIFKLVLLNGSLLPEGFSLYFMTDFSCLMFYISSNHSGLTAKITV